MNEQLEKIYRDEIHPLLAGAIAGMGIAIGGSSYTYRGVPEGIEKEMKRSIMKIARAYHKSKQLP